MSDWGEGVINNNIGWGKGFNNTIGWGGIYPNSYSGETVLFESVNRLLTSFPMSTGAAYSLLNLAASVTNVIRIRRSSDNSESNFTAAQITDGTLLTFCGSGSGFVTTWYDQSGNSANAIQTTAASQPLLVLNGVINLQSGKPAIAFDGTNDFLSFNGEVLNKGNFLSFAVVKNNRINAVSRIFDQSTSNGGALVYDSTGATEDRVFGITSAGTVGSPSSPISTNYSLLVGQILSGKSKLRRNAVLLNTNTTAFTMSGNTGIPFVIGDNSPAGSNPFQGNLQALVIYTTDQDNNIAGIETVINNLYNIY